jgi:replicative superfamily II helicase
MNEMFYEELRYYVQQNNGRFLVLSAVLPNASDLAQWLTERQDTVFRDNWRPSDEIKTGMEK